MRAELSDIQAMAREMAQVDPVRALRAEQEDPGAWRRDPEEERAVKPLTRCLALIGLSVGALAAPALAADVPLDTLVARLRQRIPALMDQAAVPGVQVAVVRDGTVAWLGAFGVAGASTQSMVTDDSVFEAASLSKPVFAYAVLKLVDAGCLDLDVPLAKDLPGPYDLGDDARVGQITARHVLSHRTGFPNWRPNGRPLTIAFAPGERFSYSGEGFVYLAAAVERITGESLEAFMRRSVFEPLAMTSSSYVWQDRYEGLKVFNHDILGRQSGRGRPWRANAAASLHTTARDYARFMVAVMSGAGLRPTTAAQLAVPQARPDEAGFNTASVAPTGREVPSLAWGLGWGLLSEAGGWLLWHWGDNGDTKAYVALSRARKSGMVMFLNSGNGLGIAQAIAEEVIGGLGPSFSWLRESAVTPAFGAFVRAMRDGGTAQALAQHRASRAATPPAATIDESTMNDIGYALLRAGKKADAIDVLLQNVADHPGSWNAFDSLGEAYAVDGNTVEAIKAYERSLALNPGNAGGAAALKRLRESR